FGTPPPPPPGRGGFRPLHVALDGQPVRFDPCRPVHWVMRERGAPPGALALVRAQVDAVARATGLRFVHDGLTDEPVDQQRAPYQPERYGDRWAPVLVAWTDEREHPALAGPTAGVGGATVVDDGGLHLVGGVVLLDRPALTTPWGSLRPGVGRTVLHELGHLVGLDHVDDRTQLMQSGGRATSFGDGDRRGLHVMGSGPCSTTTPGGP
ncbi:MAG: peptidase, partial [Actinomycetota bacterium]|nr:peptidase [Actinomycetota bacterium]